MAYSFFCVENFIDEKERCIKVNDTYTELFLYYFIEVLKEKKEIDPWFHDILLKHYIEQSQGSCSTFMSLKLIDLYLDQNRLEVYIELLKDLKSYIASTGNLIPPEFGNKYINREYQSEYTKPIKSGIIIDLIDHIRWILGDINKKPSQRFNISSENNTN